LRWSLYRRLSVVGNRILTGAKRTSSALFLTLQKRVELLVLVADEFNQIGVRHEPLVDTHRPWPCVRLRIVNRHVDFERAVRGPPVSFCPGGGVGHRMADHVEPSAVLEAGGADDERVAIPVPD